jgi:hypothetical protein
MAKGLTDLLKGGNKAGKPFVWMKVAAEVFENLKTAFTIVPILRHFDPILRILVKTDISGFAITGMISQLFGERAEARWHPVTFYSRKMTDIETRYETHDIELLAIVLVFRIWHYYLAYSQHPVIVKTDYNNLKYFMTKRKLNSRQIR